MSWTGGVSIDAAIDPQNQAALQILKRLPFGWVTIDHTRLGESAEAAYLTLADAGFVCLRWPMTVELAAPAPGYRGFWKSVPQQRLFDAEISGSVTGPEPINDELLCHVPEWAGKLADAKFRFGRYCAVRLTTDGEVAQREIRADRYAWTVGELASRSEPGEVLADVRLVPIEGPPDRVNVSAGVINVGDNRQQTYHDEKHFHFHGVEPTKDAVGGQAEAGHPDTDPDRKKKDSEPSSEINACAAFIKRKWKEADKAKEKRPSRIALVREYLDEADPAADAENFDKNFQPGRYGDLLK
jgi:hypothetical protein